MMYTLYDYSLLAEPFFEDKHKLPESLFSTDPNAYLAAMPMPADTSLPDLFNNQSKKEFTRG